MYKRFDYLFLRFMLPKGSEEGTTHQLFFFVYPCDCSQDVNEEDYHHMANIDQKPYGYPLERVIKHESVFDIPNAHFHEVKIFHEDIYELGGTKQHHLTH